MFWKEQPIHVIDFEGSPRYGVVEYGVVTLHSGQIAQISTALCAPDTEMTAKEIALHGIRTRDTAGALPFAEQRELFFHLRKTGCLCAHHASVENGFLKRIWPYPPLSNDFSDSQQHSPLVNSGAADALSATQQHPPAESPPDSEAQPRAKGTSLPAHTQHAKTAAQHATTAAHRTHAQTAQWGPWIDTRALYATLYPGLESYSLGELVKTFALGERLTQLASAHCPHTRRKAHCALYDALASALLLLHLGAEDGFEHLTLRWLLDHSAASTEARDTRRQQELF